ncbi:MAG: Na+/H+ antiporter NhaA [Clostridium sp.]|nr:Na+/H+ antiporter NhaA [Bacteroides sp.]MCM1198548.1 Na+/H+ antiporter NhaA [Clostridium sp.]
MATGNIEDYPNEEEGLSMHRNREILHTFNSFLHNEATGGILLLICAVVAVIMATVPGGQWFDRMWDTGASLSIGNFSIDMTIRDWINDALMAVFFFYVGLEIKREMLVGQLSSIRRSILPIMAALGGMLVPAILYTLFNHGNPDMAHGWGIPMATDIAFAIGVLSILGSRVPAGIKVFLTALAIADDLGAIIVLAIFYPTHALHLGYLLYVALIMLVLAIFSRCHIRNKMLYLIPGLFMWYFTYKSGVHATISGVLLAMVIPSRGNINEIKFHTKISYLLKKFKLASNGEVHVLASPEQQHIIHSMEQEISKVDPLMHIFESRLHPIVTFLIMPLFALSNAGVAFDLNVFSGQIPTITLGIFFGLLFGKPIGIFLFSFISIRCGLAQKPQGVSWLQLAAAGVLGGIGFTMSIFVNGLSFSDPALTDLGKISILLTSVTAAVLGLIAVASTCRGKAEQLTAADILPAKTNRIKHGNVK